MRKYILIFVIAGWQLPLGTSRSWTEIDLYHDLFPEDSGAMDQLYEDDPFFFTMSPTYAPPSAAPSTQSPSESPTLFPTITPSPTSRPSRAPSGLPTPSPSWTPSSSPTAAPSTPSPTQGLHFPPNPPPLRPDGGYFNYDTRSISRYGPGQPQLVHRNSTYFEVAYLNNGWTRVSTRIYKYWNEFSEGGFGPWKDTLSQHNPRSNKCSNVGQQSPIDLVETEGARCRETHQIRARPGDLRLSHKDEIEKQILSNKLRLKYARRPCRRCREPDPPLADFPHNWAGLIDMLHIDFKIPSEHTINGKRFDGEMQMFYLHPGRARTPVASVLMEATDSGFNSELQRALDEFQEKYDKDLALCAKRQVQQQQVNIPRHNGQGRKLESDAPEGTNDEEMIAEWGAGDISRLIEERRLQINDTAVQTNETVPQTNETTRLKQWNPHHPMMVTSAWFYGYEGSLTEPPCSEFVSWRVIDKPMNISYGQLIQMKRLIFTHVSPECKFTSTHYAESVARPIQDTGDRPVWHCTSARFAADAK